MITKIRVGIPILGSKNWFAGVSLVETLVKAVVNLSKDERPQLFLVVSDGTLPGFHLHQPFAKLFDGIIFVGQHFTAAKSVTDLPIIYCISYEELFTKIDFLFPVNSKVWPDQCAASWIPDFQHRYLPDFFSEQECIARDKQFGRIAEQAKLIVFTTHSVERDFLKFYPAAKAVTRVLSAPFYPDEIWYTGNPEEIQIKYGLPDRFILCSNQFWIHKNHATLFKAIALLRQTGQDVHLVCTGFTHDFRWPGYFQDLQQYITKLGITDLIHILGLIPRYDQVQLIRRSLFVVQPSLFEGLSMIVQECKALGKKIILSDLDVHYEQKYGIYFRRTNYQDLSQKIAELLTASQPGPDLLREAEAKIEAATLVKRFSKEFCNLVQESQYIFRKLPYRPKIYQPTNGKNTVTVATSLAPGKDLDNQKKAINSWIKLGFKVVAINSCDEIAIIKPYFPDIEFVAAEKDARARFGKPYIYFDDFLAYFAKQDSAICGIINSDIHLIKENLHSFIFREAINSAVLGSRIDIDSLDNLNEGTPFPGFDYFFFDKQIIPCYPKTEFCIGLAWWDYWAPLIPLACKLPVKKLITPIAYHIKHPGLKDLNPWTSLGLALAKHIFPKITLSEEMLGNFQLFVFDTIQKHSQNIAFMPDRTQNYPALNG